MRPDPCGFPMQVAIDAEGTPDHDSQPQAPNELPKGKRYPDIHGVLSFTRKERWPPSSLTPPLLNLFLIMTGSKARMNAGTLSPAGSNEITCCKFSGMPQ